MAIYQVDVFHKKNMFKYLGISRWAGLLELCTKIGLNNVTVEEHAIGFHIINNHERESFDYAFHHNALVEVLAKWAKMSEDEVKARLCLPKDGDNEFGYLKL